VRKAVGHINYFAGLGYEVKGQTVPSTPDNLHLTVREPYGVVGRIIPFNHPISFAASRMAAPLIAGNTIVEKPSDQSPLSAAILAEIAAEVMPPGVVNIVTGTGKETGDALVRHPKVKRIAFIGSVQTGMAIQKAASETAVKHVTLELGGKNPLIVRANADIAKAAEGAVASSFANTGQMCIHTERVLVHTDVYDAFRDAFVHATQSLRLGQTFDYTVDIGSLATPAQLATVAEHVEEARAAGARILTGGRARPDLGPLMYEPTILEGVDASMTVCHQETFGPVVSLYPFSTDAEAIELANEGSYGLSASIWSADVRLARRMAAQIRSGSVNINDGAAAAAGSIEAPMGGMGDSGLGRRHGAEGIRKYTEAQTVAEQRGMALGPPASMTLDQFVALTNGQLKLLRKLRVR
jgi:succinate-semialdehyde dehydrogenase/glutarate-semialdehyde dehydrogenase